MSDPFEALWEPVQPVAPDPLFDAHLRARLVRALSLPKGVIVSDLTLDADLARPPEAAAPAPAAAPASASVAEPAGPASASVAEPAELAAKGVVAYVSLWVPDADRAARFFGDVLGWNVAAGYTPGEWLVAGQSLPHGLHSGYPDATLFLCYAVADLDGAVERVRAAGGLAHAPQDEPYGRISNCSDDQGVAFAMIEAPWVGTAAVDEHQGDVAYITMEVVDSARTRAFYGSVLGLRFRLGHVDDGWQIENLAPIGGLHGGYGRATNVPMYRVDDIAAVVERVRVLGGRATDPERQPYGITSDCADDQGTRFYLGQF